MANTTNTAPAQARVGRGDVSITWILLWLTAIAMAAATIGASLYDWLRGQPMTIPVAVPTTAAAPELDSAGLKYSFDNSDVLVQVPHPSLGQRLLGLAGNVLLASAVIIGVLLAARVVRAVDTQAVFTHRFVRTLRTLALYVAVAGSAVPLILLAIEFALSDTLNLPSGPAVTFSFGAFPLPWQWVLIGAFLGVLAEAANRARRMQDELAGLV